MQRRNAASKRSGAVAADGADAADAVVAAPTAAAAAAAAEEHEAAASTGKPATAAAATPSKADAADVAQTPEEELRGSARFIILRSALLLAIFFLLHTMTTWYLLEPWFQPHRTAEYKQAQEMAQRAHIAKHVCPPGQDCHYDLKPEFKL